MSLRRSRSGCWPLTCVISQATAQTTSAPGDAVRGKTIFEGNGRCLECHRNQGARVSRVGPGPYGDRVGPAISRTGNALFSNPTLKYFLTNRFRFAWSSRIMSRLREDCLTRILSRCSLWIPRRGLRFVRKVKSEGVRLPRQISDAILPRKNLIHKKLADLVSYLVSLKGNGQSMNARRLLLIAVASFFLGAHFAGPSPRSSESLMPTRSLKNWLTYSGNPPEPAS